MKKAYIIKANEWIRGGAFKAEEVINHLVREDAHGNLLVKVHGNLYQGQDLHALQLELSTGNFPYVIEEILLDDDPSLGRIYETLHAQSSATR